MGQKNILHLARTKLDRINNQEIINNNTKEYITQTEMGMCTFSEEKITTGSPVRILNCGHYFKKEYIDIWLSDNDVCPMCRKKFIIE